MAKRDVEAVQRLLDAFNRGDFSALDEIDPDAELQDERASRERAGTTGTRAPSSGR
jgi:ketosteroid isomerase-like protein